MEKHIADTAVADHQDQTADLLDLNELELVLVGGGNVDVSLN